MTIGGIAMVIVVAILAQVWNNNPSPYYFGNARRSDTIYGLGWPRQFFYWAVVEEMVSDPPLDGRFVLEERTWRLEQRTEIDAANIDVKSLMIVITWWTAIGCCVVNSLPLLGLRWSLKNLLLLQASIAVLVFLR